MPKQKLLKIIIFENGRTEHKIEPSAAAPMSPSNQWLPIADFVRAEADSPIVFDLDYGVRSFTRDVFVRQSSTGGIKVCLAK